MISWVLDAKFKKQKSMPTMALEKEVSYSNILVLLFKFHNIIKRLEGVVETREQPVFITPGIKGQVQSHLALYIRDVCLEK